MIRVSEPVLVRRQAAPSAVNRNPAEVPGEREERREKRTSATWDPKVIRPLPGQPRVTFDPDYMSSLRASIESEGLQKPIEIWFPADLPEGWAELVDGDRRLQTVQRLGWGKVAVNIRYPRDREEAIDWSEVMNFNQAPHTPMELAWTCDRRLKRGDRAEDIARCFGKSVGWVEGHAILIDLHPDLQALIARYSRDRDALPLSRARKIAVFDRKVQRKIYKDTKGMAQARFEAHIASLKGEAPLAPGRRAKHPSEGRRVWLGRFRRIEEQLDTLLDVSLIPLFPAATRREDVREMVGALDALSRRIKEVRSRLTALNDGAGKGRK